MNKVYVASDNIITSLGFSTAENVSQMKKNISGVIRNDDPGLFPEPLFLSVVDSKKLTSAFPGSKDIEKYTRFEQLIISSITEAAAKCAIDLASADTIFIYSTTKGNIDLLDQRNRGKFDSNRINLWKSAAIVNTHFANTNTPLIISNACISGVLAIIAAYDLIMSGRYKNAVVAGGDIVSEFVVSGFQSFKSLSAGPCKPFDSDRDGLNIGEGAGTLILTSDLAYTPLGEKVVVMGGATSNDANHISGPSRTGEGLLLGIQAALKYASLKPAKIDFISAHGTATEFNDEMESKAITLAGLVEVPVNSFKGYFGHTLGAAGVIESVLTIHSMRYHTLFKTIGFTTSGVPEPINVVANHYEKEVIHTLKTASGFGGCNAAVIFGKTS